MLSLLTLSISYVIMCLSMIVSIIKMNCFYPKFKCENEIKLKIITLLKLSDPETEKKLFSESISSLKSNIKRDISH